MEFLRLRCTTRLVRPQFIACAGNATNTGHYIRAITTARNLKEYRDNVGTGNVMGTFRLVTSIAVGADPRYFSVNDLDGDGDGAPNVANFGSNSVSVLNQRSPFPTYTKTDYPVGAGPVFITSVDLNGDNCFDIITTNQTGNSVSVLIDKGNGTFFPAVEIALPGTLATIGTSTDFDGDGKRDLVLGLSDAGGVAGVLGKGDGSFEAPLFIPVGNGPRSTVQVTDLNGDGRPDIVLPLAREGAIAVLINSGAAATATSGTFFSAPTGSGSGSSGISVAGGGPTCAFSHAASIPTTGAMGAGACRNRADDIAGFIDAQQLDVDQSGGLRPINALTDGLSLLRTMLGLTEMAVTAGLPASHGRTFATI